MKLGIKCNKNQERGHLSNKFAVWGGGEEVKGLLVAVLKFLVDMLLEMKVIAVEDFFFKR